MSSGSDTHFQLEKQHIMMNEMPAHEFNTFSALISSTYQEQLYRENNFLEISKSLLCNSYIQLILVYRVRRIHALEDRRQQLRRPSPG